MNAPCKITEVAELLGLKAHSKSADEWRFGNKGSLCSSFGQAAEDSGKIDLEIARVDPDCTVKSGY